MGGVKSRLVAGVDGLEGQLRFRLYSIFVVLALPNMLVFGLVAVRQANYTMAALVLASAIGLVAGWLLVRSGKSIARVFRANGLVFGLLVIDMLVIGGDDHSKSLWINTYPLIMIFLLGEREGAAWSGGLLVAAIAVMAAAGSVPAVHAYPADFAVRLVLVYLVVSSATFGFEHARRRYRDRLMLEQQRLEDEKRRLAQEVQERQRAEGEKEQLIGELREALAQVQTLKGLVPICSNCHRIRDDQGFWSRLESYLQTHAGTRFSHGICPSCMATLYPDLTEPGDPT